MSLALSARRHNDLIMTDFLNQSPTLTNRLHQNLTTNCTGQYFFEQWRRRRHFSCANLQYCIAFLRSCCIFSLVSNHSFAACELTVSICCFFAVCVALALFYRCFCFFVCFCLAYIVISPHIFAACLTRTERTAARRIRYFRHFRSSLFRFCHNYRKWFRLSRLFAVRIIV